MTQSNKKGYVRSTLETSPAKPKTLFLGSKPLGLQVLSTLAAIDPESLSAVVTFDDSDDARSCLQDFRDVSHELSLPLELLPKPSALDAVLARHEPRLVVVCGWYWLIAPETLAKVPEGWVGLHASLLPRYRGFAPLVWALLNGEREAGVSVFHLGDGVDTGDILAQRSFALDADATIADALRLAEGGFLEALREVWPALLAGTAARTPPR